MYFAVMTIALENLCFSADTAGPLKTANRDYMALVQGSSGILDAKGTREQLRYMIDGCITAGITDRLYGNVQQPMSSAIPPTAQKKLHVLLAYAFYALGFGDCTGIGQIKNFLGVHDQPTWSNFDREFAALCALAFDKGTIYQYKNNLEDVIRRTAKGLSFDDFLEEDFYPSDEEGERELGGAYYPYLGMRSKHKEYSPSQIAQTMRSKHFPTFVGKYAKKGTVQPVQLANLSQSPVGMTSQPPSPLTVSTGGADSALQKIERYYTDTELAALDAIMAGKYRDMKAKGKPAKLIAMALQLNKKYEGE